MSSQEPSPHSAPPKPSSLRLELAPVVALKSMADLAETWGGGWQADEQNGPNQGRLVIPVLAGLRRGYVGYGVTAQPEAHGTRLHFVEEESDLQVHKPTVVVLLIAAVAGLSTLVMPFMPQLLPLLPPAVVLCLATWMFIVARLRNSGLEEFITDLSGEVQPRNT